MNPESFAGRVVLVGAECEESLPLRYLQASLESAGYGVTLLPFNHASDIEPVALALAASRAPLAGFSLVFTARAAQFAQLARRARVHGYTGHIVAGGHFASFHAEDLLRDEPAFDSVAIGEGERLIVELAARLHAPETVRGLVWRDPVRGVVRNPPAAALELLDTLPPPVRMTPPDAYLGLPIANLLSSRGCTHACHFCSIAAWSRQCGGPRWRGRSAEHVAREMATLQAQGYRLFNFHDDNFLPGDASRNLARVGALRAALDARRLRGIGFAIKSRPDAVTEPLFRALLEMGLFRVFLGIEAGTAASLRQLGRRQTVRQNTRALEILNALDLHVCFNLLLFNPDSTLEDVRTNVIFLQDHPHNPMNFCRAEVYAGTPLERKLRRAGRLEGSYWGYGYRIRDPRAQQAFELMHRLMFDRHHSDENVHHLAMRVDYERQLLAQFFDCPDTLRARSKAFVRDTNRSSAAFLLRILEMASRGTVPADATVSAFRDDLTRDTAQRVREAAALLAAIRTAGARCRHRNPSLPLARLGVAASFLVAAGTSALGQHAEERAAVPLAHPTPMPTTAAQTNPAHASTNAPARPPDGKPSSIPAHRIRGIAQVLAPYVSDPQDLDVELWVGSSGETTFAAVYKGGKGKDAIPGTLAATDLRRAEKLLSQLGAASFPEREQATQELLKLGTPALNLVKDFNSRQTDPEVMQRCTQILQAIDMAAPVSNYPELVEQLRAIRLGLGSDMFNRRYLLTIPGDTIRMFSSSGRRRGGHIFEMAPAPRD